MSHSLLPGDEEELHPRKGKQHHPRQSRIGSRSTVARTVHHVPEVLIKIASNAKDMKAIHATARYISRQGQLPLEDEQGRVFQGKQARRDALYGWQGVEKNHGTRREAFHIVFSMPEKRDTGAVTEAVRRFAAKAFDGHQYVFATHEDTGRPHVHLLVRITPYRGLKRLNPRKADLQRWRELFAHHLRSLGIEANATPRAARGVLDYSRSRGSIEFDRKRGVFVSMKRAPEVHQLPALIKQREQIVGEYTAMAIELAQGSKEDRALSKAIGDFVQSLEAIPGSEPSIGQGRAPER